jgi:hypothetical protein
MKQYVGPTRTLVLSDWLCTWVYALAVHLLASAQSQQESALAPASCSDFGAVSNSTSGVSPLTYIAPVGRNKLMDMYIKRSQGL